MLGTKKGCGEGEEKKLDADSSTDSVMSPSISACHTSPSIYVVESQPTDEYDSFEIADPQFSHHVSQAVDPKQDAIPVPSSTDTDRICSDDVLNLGSTEEVLASASDLLQTMKTGQRLRNDFGINIPDSPDNNPRQTIQENPSEITVWSIDDYEQAVTKLTSRLKQAESIQPESAQSRDTILRRVDGMAQPKSSHFFPGETSDERDSDETINRMALSTNEGNGQNSTGGDSLSTNGTKSISSIEPVVIRSVIAKEKAPKSSFAGWFKYFNNLRIGTDGEKNETEGGGQIYTPAMRPPVPSSLVRVAFNTVPEVNSTGNMAADIRMPDWIEKQSSEREVSSLDSTYALGESRTVIVHEIMRDGWTWSTAWSPKGDRLAVGTENHHLTIIETMPCSVWRVKHDKRVLGGPAKRGTKSIRSIAWGRQFLAVGGTGSVVSIVSPREPYPIVHEIPSGTFVGTLDWRMGAKTLIMGNRDGKVKIVRIGALDEDDDDSAGNDEVRSKVLHTIDRQRAWVNAVKFSPDGSAFAVGDDEGMMGVYSYSEGQGTDVAVSNIANFKMEDSILDIDWSSDGLWLYAGGQDFAVTIIQTDGWKAVHRIKRERWVQFVSSSFGGSHLAVGGISSAVSILDVRNQWKTAVSVSLKGMDPLAAAWHPKDQYLVLTGQNNSILAVETTNARNVRGHHLRSISPILCVDFSPDGCMAAVGNNAGIVTIYMLTGTTFTTVYEIVLDCTASLSIKWSRNGSYLVISTENKIVILSQRMPGLQKPPVPPNATGFSIAKVMRNLGCVCSVAIDPTSRFIAVCGEQTRIFDASANFSIVFDVGTASPRGASNFAAVLDMTHSARPLSMAGSWSPDGSWFALVGRDQNLVFYDTSSESASEWQRLFYVKMDHTGLALAWGPPTKTGLQYCAYGGEDRAINILEIRNAERTWEKVLEVPRDGDVYDLDWNNDGLVAAAISNGTVTVMDLSYLQSGSAVNEMDYIWQRQALTCFTEIQRNMGKNCMQTVRWIPSATGSDSVLAVGGTDGEVEIVDLTPRYRCRGFSTEETIDDIEANASD
eukprot:scaffold3084_cov144-Cylindrotheca_fusiformis.AAC.5